MNSVPPPTSSGRLITRLFCPFIRKKSRGPNSFEVTERTASSSARRRLNDVIGSPFTCAARRVVPTMRHSTNSRLAPGRCWVKPRGSNDALIS